jgi:hypothetical protein
MLFSFTLQAQPGPNPGNGGRPCADPPCGPPGNPDPPGRVPIGGLEILIAAGAALGVGKIASRKNANQPK